jgi:hypothetical protein
MTSVKHRLLTALSIAVFLATTSFVGSSPAQARSYTVKRHCYWSHHKHHCYYKRHYYKHPKKSGWNDKR